MRLADGRQQTWKYPHHWCMNICLTVAQKFVSWRWSVCSREETTCFSSASATNSLPARCFVRGPKRWSHSARDRDSTERHIHKHIASALQKAANPAGRMGPSGPPPPQGRIKKHLAGKWLVTDADLKQAISSWLRILTLIFLRLVATVRKMLKCQWVLCGSLMCTTCHSCATYIRKSE